MIVDDIYGGFWNYRKRHSGSLTGPGVKARIYRYYMGLYGCFIGSRTKFAEIPVFPHDKYGIFISTMAEIGRGCVIFQHVTIGSNTIKDHPKYGAPIIGENVYIGAGAKIIGHVNIGDNCRIGANCVVVKDMPPNTTAVAASTRFISCDTPKDNSFIPA